MDIVKGLAFWPINQFCIFIAHQLIIINSIDIVFVDYHSFSSSHPHIFIVALETIQLHIIII